MQLFQCDIQFWDITYTKKFLILSNIYYLLLHSGDTTSIPLLSYVQPATGVSCILKRKIQEANSEFTQHGYSKLCYLYLIYTLSL